MNEKESDRMVQLQGVCRGGESERVSVLRGNCSKQWCGKELKTREQARWRKVTGIM